MAAPDASSAGTGPATAGSPGSPRTFVGRLAGRIRGWDRWFAGVVAGIVLYVVAYSAIQVLKYVTYNTYAWDLGIYNQVLWSLVHGNGFAYTPEYFINPSGNYMAQHFAPDLLFIAPLYALAPSPLTLLVLQVAVVASGAFPVWLLARDRDLSPRTSGLLALSYLVFPPVWGVTWYDFHLEVFFLVAMLFAVHFWTRRRWGLLWLSLLVGLFTLESAAFLVAFLGVTLALMDWRRTWAFVRRPRLRPVEGWMPLLILAVSVVYFIAVREVQHALNPAIPAPFETLYRASSNWSVLGIANPLDPVALLGVLVYHPDRFLGAVAAGLPGKLVYLSMFLVPLFLLPLRKPWWLLPALPWFIGFGLSNYEPYFVLGFQYSAFLIPWFYIAAIAAFDPRPRAERRAHPSPYPYRDFPARVAPSAVFWCAPTYFLLVVFILFLFLPYAAAAGVPPAFEPGLATGTILPTAHTDGLGRLLALIPPDASVVTQNNLFPQVSSRANAFVVPYVPQTALAWSFVANRTNGPIRFVLLDPSSNPTAAQFLYAAFVDRGGYGLYAQSGTAQLFQRGYTGPVQFMGA